MKYLNLILFIVGGASAAAVCKTNGHSTAPLPFSNTLEGFKTFKLYTAISRRGRYIPGYDAVMTNADCAIASAKYMTYVTLDKYDPDVCAQKCDEHAGCDSFNIYIQREPEVQPNEFCPNPTAIAVTKCALYAEPVVGNLCINKGQTIGPVDLHNQAFQIAIRGSNVYNKIPVPRQMKPIIITKTEFLSTVSTSVNASKLLASSTSTHSITHETQLSEYAPKSSFITIKHGPHPTHLTSTSTSTSSQPTLTSSA